MAATFYGAALDASLPGFRFASGPYYNARNAATAAWMCIEQADREDAPVAPFRPAKQGDYFLLNISDDIGRSSVIGPYEPGDISEVRHRQAALADSLGPLTIGVLRFVYTLPSGMQAAVIEAVDNHSAAAAEFWGNANKVSPGMASLMRALERAGTR